MEYSPQAFVLRFWSRAMDACEPCQAGNRAALSGTTCAARAPVRSGCLRRVFHGVFFGLYAGLCFRTSYKWGLRPHTLSYFLYGQKVTKKPHREGTLSMGSLPYVPHPRDTPSAAPPGAATEPPPHRPPNQTGRGRGNGPPSGPQVKRRRGGRPRRGPRGPGRRPGQGPEPERRPPQGRPRRPPLPCQTRPRRA